MCLNIPTLELGRGLAPVTGFHAGQKREVLA